MTGKVENERDGSDHTSDAGSKGREEGEQGDAESWVVFCPEARAAC